VIWDRTPSPSSMWSPLLGLRRERIRRLEQVLQIPCADPNDHDPQPFCLGLIDLAVHPRRRYWIAVRRTAPRITHRFRPIVAVDVFQQADAAGERITLGLVERRLAELAASAGLPVCL